VQEDEKVLDKLLEFSPAFIGRFCAEKTELAASSKIAYLKDFECFIKWPQRILTTEFFMNQIA